jgi:putative DNA primase/helicase
MPHDCTVSGWDVSNALNAGYTWADFEASAARALKGCSAIVLYAESVKYNYARRSEQWDEVRDQWSFWEWAKNEWQKREQGGGNGGGGKNYGDYRPSRKQVLNFCQEAFNDLYGDKPWIWVFNSLHSWNVNYYTSVNTAAEIARINAYCDSYYVVKRVKNPETGQSEEIVFYPYARPKFVREVWDWVTQKVSIDAALVNPPGLNCVDGVLQLSYDPESKKWVRTLVPHDPQYYYLYPPQATYNIPAVVKPDACDTLLSCLDEPQCDIFLKTVAAALDLNTVRIYKGREIRAVLNLGLGSNGKDTLREVTAMMFGNRGMAGASLTDFKQYDEGRKFPLLQLDGALVNWPSENADCMLVDKLQSLKIAITGEDLSGEKKGKDEYKFKCKCVHFFNVNNTPKLLGAIEAITSRFAIFHYTKTYKTNPGPGELKADPRFLYDKTFVRTEVLPWYLHRVLDALDRLMSEGIDYSCTEAAFENVREESDHIYAFCKEVGIGYMPNAQITATVAWERLRQWYIANGTLEIKDLGDGKTKDIWNSQTTWGDHTVKGSNQILPRFLKLFPKATRERDSQGRNCLVGIGFLPPSNDSGGGGDSGGGYPSPNLPNSPSGSSVSQGNNSEAVLNVSENYLNQFNSNSSKGSEATEANTAISGVENLWSILTDDERTLLIQKLGLQKNSGESTPNHFQQLQNPEPPSDTASSVAVQSPSGQVQSSHVPHTVLNLANQILLCQTWVQVASVVNQDGDKLKKVASAAMTKEQSQNLVELLATHLRENPADLNQLAWVPEKLRDRALLRLKFISCRIGGAAKDSSPITAGDKVEIVLAGSRYQGQTGIVRRVFQDQGLTLYTVQLEGGKRIDYQRSDLKLATIPNLAAAL